MNFKDQNKYKNWHTKISAEDNLLNYKYIKHYFRIDDAK